jgi:pimeloyl-ACP methyl ester carboxylesterase
MNSSLPRTISTSQGKIDHYLDGTSGPLIAGFHGTPGSIEQILTIMDKMGINSSLCRRVVVNRAGYCGTPLECRNQSEQADLFAALLDTLCIKVIDVVLAFSGGAIMALEFAKRHPQRVKKLLLISPITDAHPSYSTSWKTKQIFTVYGMDTLTTLSYLFPNTAVKNVIALMSTYKSERLEQEYKKIKTSLEDYEFLLKILRLNSPFKRIQAGFRNENNEFQKVDIKNYTDLKLPILILHGCEDGDVDISYSQKLCKLVPSASLIEVKDGNHLLMTGKRFRKIQKDVLDFCEIIFSQLA